MIANFVDVWKKLENGVCRHRYDIGKPSRSYRNIIFNPGLDVSYENDKLKYVYVNNTIMGGNFSLNMNSQGKINFELNDHLLYNNLYTGQAMKKPGEKYISHKNMDAVAERTLQKVIDKLYYTQEISLFPFKENVATKYGQKLPWAIMQQSQRMSNALAILGNDKQIVDFKEMFIYSAEQNKNILKTSIAKKGFPQLKIATMEDHKLKRMDYCVEMFGFQLQDTRDESGIITNLPLINFVESVRFHLVQILERGAEETWSKKD